MIFEGRPSWRSIVSFYAAGLLAAAVLGFLGKLIDTTGTGVIVFVVVLSLAVLVGFLRRVGTSYTITSERLQIKRGLLSRRVQQTSLQRVQNVNTSQSFFERILQVGTVDFDTAGTDDSDFTFIGVAQPEQVVAAVDRAQREAAAGAPEPPASAV